MKEIILEYLKKQKAPVKKAELINFLVLEMNISFFDYFDEGAVRLAIQELTQEGHAISSSEKGYKIITTEAELLEAQKYLKQRCFSLFQRCSNLHNAFYKNKENQLTINEFLK